MIDGLVNQFVSVKRAMTMMPTRNRYRISPSTFHGILTQLTASIHWVGIFIPYNHTSQFHPLLPLPTFSSPLLHALGWDMERSVFFSK